MNIYYFSDIHLENYPDGFDQLEVAESVLNRVKEFFNVVEFKRDDFLILAGDICELRHVDQYDVFFKSLSSVFSRVVYIPGNHEYYRTTLLCDVRFESWRSKLFDFGVHLVNNEVAEFEDLVIVGTTLWGRGNGGHHTDDVVRKVNDFRYIKVLSRGIYRKFWLRDYKCLSSESSLFIKNALTDFEKTDKRLVVVTHHSPSFTLALDNSKFNEYIHSDVLDDIDFESGLFKIPELWIQGHQHEPVDSFVNCVLVRSNPIGYDLIV